MPDENLRPDSINKETLELLQLRLESKVRENFMKSVAIPIGSGGIIAIVLAALFWLPAQVKEILASKTVQTGIEANVQKIVGDHFAGGTVQRDIELRVQKAVASELDKDLPEQVRESVTKSVASYFSTPEAQNVIRTAVLTSTESQFQSPETKERVKAMVSEHLGNEGKHVVVESVNEALKPSILKLSETVEANKARLVAEIDQQQFQWQEKGPDDYLASLFQPEKVKKINDKGQPVILTVSADENIHFTRDAMLKYIAAMKKAFPQFRYVAVSQGQDRHLLALIPMQKVEASLQAGSEAFIQIVNSRKPEDGMRKSLEDLFGLEVARAMTLEEKAIAVLLRKDLWPNHKDLDDSIGVVDSKKRLVALASRRTLIQGLLDRKQ